MNKNKQEKAGKSKSQVTNVKSAKENPDSPYYDRFSQWYENTIYNKGTTYEEMITQHKEKKISIDDLDAKRKKAQQLYESIAKQYIKCM